VNSSSSRLHEPNPTCSRPPLQKHARPVETLPGLVSMAQDGWENTQYNLNIDSSTFLPASPNMPFHIQLVLSGVPSCRFDANLVIPNQSRIPSCGKAYASAPVCSSFSSSHPSLTSRHYCPKAQKPQLLQDIPRHSSSRSRSRALALSRPLSPSLSRPRRQTLSKPAVIHPALGLDSTFLRHATAAEGTRTASRRSLTAMFRSIEHAHCDTHATGLRIRAAGTRLSPVRTQARGGGGG